VVKRKQVLTAREPSVSRGEIPGENGCIYETYGIQTLEISIDCTE
jgi:hypothetical protein